MLALSTRLLCADFPFSLFTGFCFTEKHGACIRCFNITTPSIDPAVSTAL
jgi:hypothetical protein